MSTLTTSLVAHEKLPFFQGDDLSIEKDHSEATPLFLKPIDTQTVLSANLERCHSSTQIVINGLHIVVFKGKQTDSTAPAGLWLTHSANGVDWSKPEQLVQAPDQTNTCWSPVFCEQPDGSALLFYRMGPSPDKLTTHVLKTENGLQFDNADNLLNQGIIGPTKTKSMLTADGDMLFASSIERGKWTSGDTNQGFTACHVEILKRNGQWQRSEPLQMPEGYHPDRGGAIEGTFFRRSPEEIGMLCRNRNKGLSANRKGGWALESVSKDNGRTWSQLKESTLPNPDSSLDVVDLGSGKLIVFYNHSHDQRSPFAFALSSNGGISWSQPNILQENEGEFPSAILQPDGLISVAYADKQGKLNHIKIDPATIEINGKPW